ncbi:hypothetical protein KBB96_12385 [Luteolibacter ambystomatis]|uniref:Uncharacterized protein n=1 Tax=Luteolibacter ambystomatis TaxID=2824561 RepID=A0A975G5F8_9BACT|nr:hypothetical protein [Luteolibacter ambystomatis]QUE49669.1 hypothetical protein KBB96_12385 [Luteolibacter ambystomatis]
MSGWNRDANESAGQDIEDLAYPPYGAGIIRKVLLGFLLPGWIGWHAVSGWLTERLYLPGKGGTGIWITGGSARWLAVSYAGMALFCHTRWFLGLLENRFRLFEMLTVVSILMIVAGMIGMWVFLFDL